MIEMEVGLPADIGTTCRRAVRIAHEVGESVSFCFNGTTMIANPDSSPGNLITSYWNARNADPGSECGDCKGSGWYVGLVEKRHCPTCGGSGHL